MAGQTAGLKPSQFTEFGLVSDVDVTFREVKFVMWDYQGKRTELSPAIMVKMVEDSGDEHEQYWSVGGNKDWVASEDGKTLVSVGSASGINVGSNGGIFITSIVNAGFPEDKIGDDITVFQGMKCHVIRVPAPKRNIVKTPRADGRTFEETILTVSKILQLPWEAKGKATGTVAGKPSGDSSGESLDATVQGVVMEILMAEGKPIPKQQLLAKVFQQVKAHPERTKIVQMVHQDSFLGGGPWQFANGMVSMG